jgi:hypothetical protein
LAAQQRQVVARAAPAVEREQGARGAGGFGEQRLDETAEPAEPEVIALGARRGFEQSIHRLSRD